MQRKGNYCFLIDFWPQFPFLLCKIIEDTTQKWLQKVLKIVTDTAWYQVFLTKTKN